MVSSFSLRESFILIASSTRSFASRRILSRKASVDSFATMIGAPGGGKMKKVDKF